MKAKTCDKGKCGIYIIRNIVNGKAYIGKSINIYHRIVAHICSLTVKREKEENPHFIAAWHKYGRESFAYSILEECSFSLLKERELYWINHYSTTDPTKGYNKRLDSEGGMIPHIETRKKLTEALNRRYSDPENRAKVSRKTKLFWTNNPDKKKSMADNVKLTKQKKYKFIQMLEDGSAVKEYDTIEQIIEENPTFKWQNIYAVCNGYKHRIYGYKWKKELKI